MDTSNGHVTRAIQCLFPLEIPSPELPVPKSTFAPPEIPPEQWGENVGNGHEGDLENPNLELPPPTADVDHGPQLAASQLAPRATRPYTTRRGRTIRPPTRINYLYNLF